MLSFRRLILIIIGFKTVSGYLNSSWLLTKAEEGNNFYVQLLNEIKNQRPYDGLLIVDNSQMPDT